jgi:hypothetical protein
MEEAIIGVEAGEDKVLLVLCRHSCGGVFAND